MRNVEGGEEIGRWKVVRGEEIGRWKVVRDEKVGWWREGSVEDEDNAV